jgi:threonine aldolase
MAHCQRGEEFVIGALGHSFRYEAGGAAVLGSLWPQPLDYEADGSLDLKKVAALIKPDDAHFARTRLLVLEDTQNGRALPLTYIDAAAAFARERGLGLHLDGARAFNAAVKLGVPVREIARHFDSVSLCLSKGLGAPVGSVLVGGKDFIGRAHRIRKMLGGGMRQAGVLAAACLHALEHHVERLAEDHANARALAEGLSGLPGLKLDPSQVQTNMVFASMAESAKVGALVEHLKAADIVILPNPNLRLVTHLDVSRVDVDKTIVAFKNFFR